MPYRVQLHFGAWPLLVGMIDFSYSMDYSRHLLQSLAVACSSLELEIS